MSSRGRLIVGGAIAEVPIPCRPRACVQFSMRQRVSPAFAQGAQPAFIMTSHPADALDRAPEELDQLGITPGLACSGPAAGVILDYRS